MNILIANVGNVRMNEIKALAAALQKKKHTVTIACMAVDSSYKGQAFSFGDSPVRVNHIVYQEGKIKSDTIHAYEFYSTPADAVSIMLGEIMADNRPDLVICGINNGIHMGQDIYCSSNIGMAMEAAYFGVPVFAVGIEKRIGGHTEAECAVAAKFIEKNLEKIAALKISKSTFLNINIPTVEKYTDLKGVKVARLGWLNLINEFEEKTDHKGSKYYWAKNIERKSDDARNGFVPSSDDEEGTAMHAFSKGYVAITPINYNATSFRELKRYEELLAAKHKKAEVARKPLRIMLVNEKGCFHPGIIALAKVLSVRHRVNIIAPLNPLNGVGHSFTTSQEPLRVRQYFVLNNVKIFSVSGTPCDCVTLGLDRILKTKPDVIISGIDTTNNRGETIFSSGVVSAAVEGTIQGIKSISLGARCENAKGEKDYLPVARLFEKYLYEFTDLISPGITLNVNFPANFMRRSIKFTHATDGLIDNKYEGELNPFGTQFYWLKTPRMGFGLEAFDQKGDLYWLKKNNITVTPIKLNLTCEESIQTVEEAKIKV